MAIKLVNRLNTRNTMERLSTHAPVLADIKLISLNIDPTRVYDALSS